MARRQECEYPVHSPDDPFRGGNPCAGAQGGPPAVAKQVRRPRSGRRGICLVLAMAPVFVAGTVRRISSNTNHVFSRAASRFVATGGEGRLLVDADDSKSENFEQPAVDRPRRRRGRMLAPFFLFVFLLTSVDINRSAGSTNRLACQPEAAPRLQCHQSSGRARRIVP